MYNNIKIKFIKKKEKLWTLRLLKVLVAKSKFI